MRLGRHPQKAGVIPHREKALLLLILEVNQITEFLEQSLRRGVEADTGITDLVIPRNVQ